MSQDRLVKLACSKCGRINYWSSKSKMASKGADASSKRLEFKKYCRFCKSSLPHKEAKK